MSEVTVGENSTRSSITVFLPPTYRPPKHIAAERLQYFPCYLIPCLRCGMCINGFKHPEHVFTHFVACQYQVLLLQLGFNSFNTMRLYSVLLCAWIGALIASLLFIFWLLKKLPQNWRTFLVSQLSQSLTLDSPDSFF
jgi:hypothetical protein